MRSWLEKEGIDVNQPENGLNLTPLCTAAENGDTNLVELLLRAEGIKVNMATKHGTTALSLAAQVGFINIYA